MMRDDELDQDQDPRGQEPRGEEARGQEVRREDAGAERCAPDPEPCQRTEDRLPLYVGGDLDARATEEVRDHLSACEACAERASDLRGAFDAYFATQHREAADELAGRGLWPELRARIEAEAAGLDASVADGLATGAARDGAGSGSSPRSEQDSALFAAANSASPGAPQQPADLDSDLEWEIAGAGTISQAGVRGPRALRVLFGGVGLAAGVVLTAMVLWKEPRWDGSPGVGANPTDAVVVDHGADSGAESVAAPAPGTMESPEDAGAADQTADSLPVSGPGAVAGGLRPIGVEDDGERLIYTQRPSWVLPTGPQGGQGQPTLAGDGWH